MYDRMGGIPALEEVKFSIAATRGCFGCCSFCALTYPSGADRFLAPARNPSSNEAKTADRRSPISRATFTTLAAPRQISASPPAQSRPKYGACADRQCLFPGRRARTCSADHTEYIAFCVHTRALPKVKKVFIRSGIRFDYLLADKKSGFLNELVRHHVSGQLKVAPEHVSPNVLKYMGKPKVEVYNEFVRRYQQANEKLGMKQYLAFRISCPVILVAHSTMRFCLRCI